MAVLMAVFAIFIPALILPGPDFIAVARSSITRGSRAGLLTTLGVTPGLERFTVSLKLSTALSYCFAACLIGPAVSAFAGRAL